MAPDHWCAATCIHADALTYGCRTVDSRRRSTWPCGFPIFGGVLLRRDRRSARRGRRVVHAAPRRDAGAGRRIRLRQDHGRPRDRQHPARDELPRGDRAGAILYHHAERRRRSRARSTRGADAAVPIRHPDGVPGSVLVAESAEDRRPDRRRAAADPHAGCRGRAGRSRPLAAREGRPVAGAREPLSARILRRSAPADRHRARARDQSRRSSSPTSR